MVDSKSRLRKLVFTKADHANMVLQKGCADDPQICQMEIVECLIGDETGMIIFTTRNDQELKDLCVDRVELVLPARCLMKCMKDE
ncbi:hypothetical protein K2173_002511 [Erythroxylum novogranatense]|uniref:Single-stranded DNA binding protein Ssb-like OB fold domain-containing protein n=1 Tax=Erythroxylum novogranatense TaxID=1862640 RepID=A0AAV8TQY5_9ROSI|nr:hypothetical protein K2173_002511 [Erythroxylum novogranatense]